MKPIRYTAAAVTGIMALLNLPVALQSDELDMPSGAAQAATVLGVLGLLAAVALFRHVTWAAPAVVGVGLLNLAAGIVAVGKDWEGGPVGILLGIAGAAAGAALLARPGRTAVRAG